MAEPQAGRRAAPAAPPASRPANAPTAAEMQAEIEEALAVGERMRQDLAVLDEQRGILAEILQDYQRGRMTLEALAASEGEIEALLPLGGGNYVPAKLAGGARVVSAIGAGVHVESTIADALARLKAREDNAQQSAERLAEESRKITNDMNRLNTHLQTLAQGARGE